MREIRTSGSVGAWGGKRPGLPDPLQSELWGRIGARICRQASFGKGCEAKLPTGRPDGGCFSRAGQKQSTPCALPGVRRPPTDPSGAWLSQSEKLASSRSRWAEGGGGDRGLVG